MIEGEQYPCPGLAFIPKADAKSTRMNTDLMRTLNNMYEVSVLVIIATYNMSYFLNYC